MATKASDSTTTTTFFEEAPSTPTTSGPLSASSFLVEPCASIVGSPPARSHLDLRPFLLAAAQLPAGAVVDDPQQTSSTVSRTYASVPTTSPAAYEGITLLAGTTTPGGSGGGLGLNEVIGDVGSVGLARPLLSELDADMTGPNCNSSNRQTIPLPGTSPPVSATIMGGESRAGSVLGERLFAAKGSRLLCLTWNSGNTVNGSGPGNSSPPNPAPLPDASEMAQVLNAALALIPSS
jgi:hypothetical protein